MFLAEGWKDYTVLDTGDGEKLERWGDVLLARPDPQVIWPKRDKQLWQRADARYVRSSQGGGAWQLMRPMPDNWRIAYGDLSFIVKPTGFKHTGLFPEQAANWDWMRGLMRGRTGMKVLNLFAYTGGATCALAKEGVHVTHVDAAKGMVLWAKDNRDACGVSENNTRFIIEDAVRFVEREYRRGNRYDGILMDPPSYGRGPTGEVWKLENELFPLVEAAAKVLCDRPAFFLINSYTTGFQASVLANILGATVQRVHGGVIRAEELCLPVQTGGVLPCGASGRWQAE